MDYFSQQVPPEQRTEEVNILGVALRGVGLPATYVYADLVHRVILLLAKKGGQADLKDLTRVHQEHKERWTKTE